MPSSLGQKTAEESFVAVDFGTRASRVAAARGETIVRAADMLGETEFPSVLALSPQGGLWAGADARQTQALFPAETLIALKSLLTADAAELGQRGIFFPHGLDTTTPSLLRLEIGGRRRTPIELVGLYLSFLRRTAEISFERPVASGVFTVPVDFTPFDRQGLRLAARLAGFARVRLIDEPTAVALDWAAQGFRGRLAVCCWGAGHFGASILEAQPDLVRVRSSVGSGQIGGDRIDQALAADFLARLEAQLGPPGLENRAHIARHLLGLAAAAKHELASKAKADVRISIQGRGEALRHTYTRADLDAWLEPHLDTAAELCRALFADAGLLRGDVDALVLAGGMARIDRVARSLAEAVGRPAGEPDASGDAALRGALRRARFLDRDAPEPLLLDALPLALGLETQGGQVIQLLGRSEILPASKVELFTTYLEKQSEVGIQLYGHHGLRWDKLARIEVTRIPAMKESEPQLEVSLLLDEDGTLECAAQETTRNKPLTLEVRPERGLPATQLATALQEIPAPDPRPFSDSQREELRERGRLLLETVRSVIKQLPGALTRDDKQLLTAKAKELEEVIANGDLVELRSCSRELAEAAHPVLQRVHDKSLEALLR